MTRSLTIYVLAMALCGSALGGAFACGRGERSDFDLETNLPSSSDASATFDGDAAMLDTASDTPCGSAATAKGYAGCDFRVAPPPVLGTVDDLAPCYAVFLTNVAKAPTPIKVSLGTTVFDATQFARIPNGTSSMPEWTKLDSSGLKPGEMAVLFLSHQPGARGSAIQSVLTCPVPPATMDAEGLRRITAGRGVTYHIETEQPVVAYDIQPFGGARSFAPSAEIILPTSAWGTNYMSVLPPSDPMHLYDDPSKDSWLLVAATEDGTTVQAAAGVAPLIGVGTDNVDPSTKGTVNLDAGQYVLWLSSRTATTDASGTVFTSNKPISLTIGDMFTTIASATSIKQADIINGIPQEIPYYCCADGSHQMLPPVSGLGSDYVVGPYPTRMAAGTDESIRYRLLGIVDGTTLVYDPPIPGAPATIASRARFDFETTGPVHVKSQDDKHPFYVAQMMSFANVAGGTKQDGTDGIYPSPGLQPVGIGDPEFVNVLPVAQFLTEYTFLTDPTYATTGLSIVRVKGAKGFSDVQLACLGTITGWQPIGSSGQYEFARVDLTRKYVPNGSCDVNVHKATSESPFGVHVWGVDWFASYAYPAGGSVAKLNDVVVVPH